MNSSQKCRGKMKKILNIMGFWQWAGTTVSKNGHPQLLPSQRISSGCWVEKRNGEKITKQIMHYNIIGRQRSVKDIKSHSVLEWLAFSWGKYLEKSNWYFWYLLVFRYKGSIESSQVFSAGLLKWLIWGKKMLNWAWLLQNPCSPWVNHFCQYCALV